MSLLAVVTALSLSGGLFAQHAPAGTRADGVRLLQFNLCGHACRGSDHVAGTVGALAGYRPDAAGLDEVCRGQLGAVVAGLRVRGWAMDARFLVTAPGACDGDDYGVAVLTRSPVLATRLLTYRHQVPGAHERRGLLCVRAALAGRPTQVCATHLVSAGEDRSGRTRRGQLAEAAQRTGASALPVVLMGDLNLTPGDPSMAALYTSAHGAATGALDEVDQGSADCRCGDPTHSSGKKIDYVFVSAADFMVRSASVVATTTSDHDVLRGVVATH